MNRPVELLRRRWRLICVIGFILTAALAFYLAVFVEFGPVTRASFQRLHTGMTIAEVQALLGEPTDPNALHKFIRGERWILEDSWGQTVPFAFAAETMAKMEGWSLARSRLLRRDGNWMAWRGQRFWIDVFFDEAGKARGATLTYPEQPASIWDRIRRWFGH
ncbi:MAG: hypothetical protein L0215_12700 [Gemmataceae bacterium]|nr:hypothetical protein [Gemmataceae bacterium]